MYTCTCTESLKYYLYSYLYLDTKYLKNTKFRRWLLQRFRVLLVNLNFGHGVTEH